MYYKLVGAPRTRLFFRIAKPLHTKAVTLQNVVSMTKNKGLFTLIGFLLFLYGMLALVLSLIGAKLSFLTWIDSNGALLGFVIRILMVLVGIVLVYIARTDFSGEEPVR